MKSALPRFDFKRRHNKRIWNLTACIFGMNCRSKNKLRRKIRGSIIFETLKYNLKKLDFPSFVQFDPVKIAQQIINWSPNISRKKNTCKWNINGILHVQYKLYLSEIYSIWRLIFSNFTSSGNMLGGRYYPMGVFTPVYLKNTYFIKRPMTEKQKQQSTKATAIL